MQLENNASGKGGRIAVWKHQITSTCLRRSGFAQAGQITNKSQWSKFEISNKVVSVIPYWYL
jgi:hypothetical protein